MERKQLLAILFLLINIPTLYSINDFSTLYPKEINQDSKQIIGNYFAGTIRDKITKEPIIGAAIFIEGSKNGTVSDIDGHYKLKIDRTQKEYTLVFSCLSYYSKKIKRHSTGMLDVYLEENAESIEAVVVTGYSAINKDSFTGNITKIEKKELLQANPTNLIAAIQAYDPSFRINEDLANGSNPNALPNFVLRGQTGVGETELIQTENLSEAYLSGSSNLPIFILDGSQVDVQKIYDLDMNNIHSVNILKDAAATAIYGSRAANGVVVIERRMPGPGRIKVNYSGTFSADIPDLSSYNLMNAEEKLEAERLSGFYDSQTPSIDPYTDAYYKRKNNILTGTDTYWLSQGLRTGMSNRNSLYIDGGEESIRWGVELYHNNSQGVMKHSSRKSSRGSFYIDYRYKTLQIKNKVEYGNNKSSDVPFNNFSDYAHLLPYMRLYDHDGQYVRKLEDFPGYYGNLVNPLYEINFYNSFINGGYNEVSDNFTARWDATKDLRIKLLASASSRSSNNSSFKDPASAFYKKGRPENGDRIDSKGTSTTIEGQLNVNYNKKIKNSDINTSLAINLRQTEDTRNSIHYKGFPGGDLSSPSYAKEVYGKPFYSDNKTRLAGFLATTNYTYKNLFLTDFTARIDGSSEFGSKRKWSGFWAIGTGINLHRLEYLKKIKWLSKLKIRSSYGLTGKTNFSPYSAKDIYKLDSESYYPTGWGVFLSQKGNPNLKWEKKYSLDYGVDIGLLNDRFNIKLNMYNERTVDLITDYSLASSTGFKSYKDNMGKVENKGFEVNLMARVYQDSNWMINIYGSLAKNENKIVEISEAMRHYNEKVEEIFNKYNPSKTENNKFSKTYMKYYEGASLTSIYGMKSLGISPTNGKEIFVKRNGEITDKWSANEWRVIGDSSPDGQGSFGVTIKYKRISLFTSFLYTFGGDAYNQTLVSHVENADIRNSNVDKRVLEARWQKPGDICSLKDIKDRNITTGASSRFIQKDNTLRMNSVTLNCTLGEKICKKIHAQNVRLSMTCNNLLYLSSVRRERGLNYPFSRTIRFSTYINF